MRKNAKGGGEEKKRDGEQQGGIYGASLLRGN